MGEGRNAGEDQVQAVATETAALKPSPSFPVSISFASPGLVPQSSPFGNRREHQFPLRDSGKDPNLEGAPMAIQRRDPTPTPTACSDFGDPGPAELSCPARGFTPLSRLPSQKRQTTLRCLRARSSCSVCEMGWRMSGWASRCGAPGPNPLPGLNLRKQKLADFKWRSQQPSTKGTRLQWGKACPGLTPKWGREWGGGVDRPPHPKPPLLAWHRHQSHSVPLAPEVFLSGQRQRSMPQGSPLPRPPFGGQLLL